MDQPMQTFASLAPAALAARTLRLPALLVIETPISLKDCTAHVRKELGNAGLDEAFDAKGLAAILSRSGKAFYIEHGDRLDTHVESLFLDYVSGLASFPSTGVSARFDPAKATCVVALSRAALEASYPDLVEYAGSVTSIG